MLPIYILYICVSQISVMNLSHSLTPSQRKIKLLFIYDIINIYIYVFIHRKGFFFITKKVPETSYQVEKKLTCYNYLPKALL